MRECQNINHYFNVPFDEQAVFDDAGAPKGVAKHLQYPA